MDQNAGKVVDVALGCFGSARFAQEEVGDYRAPQLVLSRRIARRYAMYQGWLAEVDLFKTLNRYELSRRSGTLVQLLSARRPPRVSINLRSLWPLDI